MLKVLSIDWLQLYCDLSDFEIDRDYKFELKPYQSQQFRAIHDIIYRNEKIAEMQSIPVSAILPKEAAIIKIQNRELYGENLFSMIDCLMKFNKISIKSITRLDIALDFQKFENGLLPQLLIDRFLKCKYLKIGRGKFNVIGEQKFAQVFDYLRFGTKTSDLNVYLYNKSKELKQVKDKIYIREMWKKVKFDEKFDVWRLEISMKAKACEVVDTVSGEVFKIKYQHLMNEKMLQNIYYSMLNKHFRFVINDNQLNKSRMQKVELFSNSNYTLKPIYLPKEHSFEYKDKLFVKYLYQYDQSKREVPEAIKLAVNDIYNHMNTNKLVHDYCSKKAWTWEVNSKRV